MEYGREWKEKVKDYNTDCELSIGYNYNGSGYFELVSDDADNLGNGIYETGGLWFEGKELIDYDGVFEIPVSVLDSLESKGLDVKDIRESL